MRPIIGITVDTHDKPNQYESPTGYSTSVEKAGGLPVLLPYKADLSLVPAYVDLLDGIIFSGGNDLDPALYGGGPYHPKAAPIDPLRQRFELALLAEVERRRLPALGICLGSQLMNVYRGGSL
ncbi:MAG TPA: gamma-glutamyl-gamma-aminobutyrate hydrolase family protein, partial [Tepidisphaeraceae bacterium]|nr:gamma-glutamyl-gamma-aminobutyrate hydrolase family protein [Tepidisphaeraceae bacterium]